MFLKRLEMTGFKSFATKSVIDFFDEKSITSIVGPNGSGKSNIADAVRWVLGEQSYKTIRSKKSEDIIFFGSKNRNKASSAKVSIVLDNSDGRAPIDFSEIEIGRIVYRDSSSDYFFNGQKSRLVDVAELLARSGFGQSTYSVIGQGMVDSMLFYGPAERKVLFDEAAGVRQYEIKKEQTIRKLSDTTNNVVRIKDILSELNPRLKILKKQTEKAKRKDEIAKNLLDKQKVYFSSIWDKLTHSEKEKRKELDRILAEGEKVKQELSGLNRDFSSILNQEKTGGSKLKELQNKIEKLEEEKDKTKQKIYTCRAQLQVKYSDVFSKDELKKKTEKLKLQIKSLDLEKKKETAKKLKKQIASSGFREKENKISALESEKDRLRQRYFSIKAKAEFLSSSGAPSAAEIKEKIEALTQELSSLGVKEKKNKQLQIKDKMAHLDKELSLVENRVKSANGKIRILSKEAKISGPETIKNELNDILKKQKLFLSKVEIAKDPGERGKLSDLGLNIVKDLERTISKIGKSKKGVLLEMDNLQQEMEALSTEKEKLASQRIQSKEELLENVHAIKQSVNRKKEIKEEIRNLKKIQPASEKKRNLLKEESEKIESRITRIDIEIANLSKKIETEIKIKTELDGLENIIKQLKTRKSELEDDIESLRKTKPIGGNEKRELQEKIITMEDKLEKIDREIEKIKKEINISSNNFSTVGKKLTAIKDGIAKKQTLINEFNREATNFKVELARVETKKQDIKEEINRELGSELELAATQVVPELDENASRAEIEKIKNRLYAIGEIDSEVESEFEEVNERVEYLSGQMGDLERAKEDLEKLIRNLDIRIKKQFEASFNSISKKFKHFFGLLFDGGEARLELVTQKGDNQEEDRLGIEIVAVPPGKRVKSLSTLSGGERTLTSLALLFAILSVNPAPFVLLDEVDASLDEPNTKKFLKIVKELSGNTQFIIVTHNRETMKESDIIYGVTMDDSHVSRLLSIKLDEALKTAKKTARNK